MDDEESNDDENNFYKGRDSAEVSEDDELSKTQYFMEATESGLLDDMTSNVQPVEMIRVPVEKFPKNVIPTDLFETDDTKVNDILNNNTSKPIINKLKLATIVMNAELPIFFNLKVISLYLPLDDHIIGIRCERVAKRGDVKLNRKKKPKNRGRKDLLDFYNQCTINIRPYGKSGTSTSDSTSTSSNTNKDHVINLKLFPNGQVSFAGIKQLEEAYLALEYVLDKINNLSGEVVYLINHVEKGNSKNFKKKLKMKLDWLDKINNSYSPFPSYNSDLFIENILTKGKDPYPNGIELSQEMAYLLTFIEILNNHHMLTHPDDTEITEEIIISPTETQTTTVIEKGDLSHPAISMLCRQIANSYNSGELTDGELTIIASYLTSIKDLSCENLLDLLSPEEALPVFYFLIKYQNINLTAMMGILNRNCNKSSVAIVKNYLTNRMFVNDVISKDEIKLIFDTLKKLNILSIEDRFTITLPAWTHKNHSETNLRNLYNRDMVNISNINTTFNMNFLLSRQKLHRLLVNKYGQDSCSFEPNYGGINFQFTSVIDCDLHTHPKDSEICPEYNGCKCKYVSILIFQNIILVTGGRSFNQINEAYQYIKHVLLTEFKQIIKINADIPDPTAVYPNIIASNTHKYIKKKFILNNQKNHFLLSKIGFLKYFE
jgi:hypothetical protein